MVKRKIQITAIHGNSQMLDGGSMFGNAPRALWERWCDVDEKGRIPLACRAMLVETEDTKILCEAGIGCYMPPELADRFGVVESSHVLQDNLESLGVSPGDIDLVILSHLHFDHSGGLLPSYEQIKSGNDRIIFEKARIVVGSEAWDRAQNPHYRDRASFIPALNQQLDELGDRFCVLAPGDTIHGIDFIDFFISQGHTPGQLHTVVKGDAETVVFCGDLVPGVPWVHLPITMGYDRYPEKLIDEKKALYERMDKSWNLFFTHDTQVAMAKVRKNQKGKYEVSETRENPRRLNI